MNWGGREQIWGSLDHCVGSGGRTPPGWFWTSAGTAGRSMIPEKSQFIPLFCYSAKPLQKQWASGAQSMWIQSSLDLMVHHSSHWRLGCSLEASSRLSWLFYLFLQLLLSALSTEVVCMLICQHRHGIQLARLKNNKQVTQPPRGSKQNCLWCLHVSSLCTMRWSLVSCWPAQFFWSSLAS